MSPSIAKEPAPDDACEKAARELRHRAHIYSRTRKGDEAAKEVNRRALEQAAVEFSLAKLKAALS